jgi:hypothetical protein
MVSCSEIQLLLGPFDDAELEPHEMEDVALHVVSCGDCKVTLEEYRALGVALRDTVTIPQIDLAPSVVAKLEAIPVPWSRRIRDFIVGLGSIGTAIEVMSVAAATAVITLVIAGPVVQRFRGGVVVGNGSNISIADSREASKPPLMPTAHTTPASAYPFQDNANVSMQELVSELGAGDSPSVAVWNEPKTNTTVVWVPDQR